MSATQIADPVQSVLTLPESVSLPRPGAAAATAKTLRRRAQSASIWTTVAYVVGQAFRLLSTVVLTRLLLEEHLGLMTMVAIFMHGLQMFSDIGTGPSLIQNKRGDQPAFYNTAWTMQVGRGVLLWLLSCIGAWPVAMWFNDQRLIWLIPICGFTSVISGFTSTAAVFLNRQLDLRRITYLEIAGQLVMLGATIAWVYLVSPSVWALVAGAYVETVFRVVSTHFLLPGHRNWFAWSAPDARTILQFGRWIFVATAMTFFAMQTDKLLFGRLMGPTSLLVYSYAMTFAAMPTQFMKKLSAQVVFPMLSEVARERPDEFYSRLRLMRLGLVAIGFSSLLPLILGGQILIDFLYPPEMHRAGWILQVLAAGSMGGVLTTAYGGALLARGNSFAPTLLLAVQLAFLAVVPLTGYRWYGEDGFIVAVAGIEWLVYPATVIIMMRHRLWQPEIDLPAVIIAAAAVVGAFFIL